MPVSVAAFQGNDNSVVLHQHPLNPNPVLLCLSYLGPLAPADICLSRCYRSGMFQHSLACSMQLLTLSICQTYLHLCIVPLRFY